MKVALIGYYPNLIQSCTYHSHNEWEIVLNLNGSGTALIGGFEYDFYPGTIFRIPPHTLHLKASKGFFNDIYIHVNEYIDSIENNVAIFMDDEGKSIENLMFMALRIFNKKEKNYASIVDALYDAIHQMLLGWGGQKPKDEIVEKFKNELIKNFTHPDFKVSDALKDTSYSSDHFRRRFKSSTGMTPSAYLNHLKIEYAKKLLRQKSVTGLSISEISFLSGFYDPHYFSRLFKSSVGKTPQEYTLS